MSDLAAKKRGGEGTMLLIKCHVRGTKVFVEGDYRGPGKVCYFLTQFTELFLKKGKNGKLQIFIVLLSLQGGRR